MARVAAGRLDLNRQLFRRLFPRLLLSAAPALPGGGFLPAGPPPCWPAGPPPFSFSCRATCCGCGCAACWCRTQRKYPNTTAMETTANRRKSDRGNVEGGRCIREKSVTGRLAGGRPGSCLGPGCHRSWRWSSRRDTRLCETGPDRRPAPRNRPADCRRAAGRPSRR